jgi:hypothetical protein
MEADMGARIVDPPSGWRYGFPKPLPARYDELSFDDKMKWFVDNGYPQSEIDKGMLKHCRSWYDPLD